MSYSDIIPNHLQEELIQIGEDITKQTFRVGDIVVAVYEFVEANGLDCTKRDIWRAVGSFVGKAAATIQGYETLARFYPPSVRKHYEELSASHFKKAMQIESSTDYNWQTVLDYAVGRTKDYGRPATVDELTHVFIYNSEEYHVEEELVEHKSGDVINGFFSTIINLRRYVELLPIPEYKRSEIKDAFNNFERIIESIMVSV